MAKTSVLQKLKHFYHQHKKLLIGSFFGFFFILIFIISVSGGLRIFFPYISQLTGFPFGHKKYLIVFQNNNEMRPAGGFISSFATADLTAGFLSNLQIEDVYGSIDDHARQTAPWPMEKLLSNQWYKGYNFRDGNYSPNFPDSAQELIRLYHLSRPTEQFDGVIAINFRVLEDLLDALGPVKIATENGEKTLSHDNLFEELTNQVNDVDRHNLESLANRKSILKPLANAIIKKILLNPFKLRKISDTITIDLSRKDLQLYFTDNSLEQIAHKNHWAGKWPTNISGDFLAINEANLGGMKSDRYLKRDVTYHVRFTEESLKGESSPTADLTLNLQHFGIENIPLSGPYSGYFRFYKSPSELANAFSTSASENLSPLEEIVHLQPGESTSINKKYDLPKSVLSNNLYTLNIPKQAGTDSDNYTIILELPRGYRIESDDFEARENFAFWQGPLSRDLKLQLKVVPDTTPPRLVLQDNTELNKISLHFNEDLNQDYAADPFSYSVTDLNLKHPETTDLIRLKKVVTTSKDVDLYLTGQTTQPEERYGVQLRNLRDTHGNVLTDRQITVVQRLNQPS